MTHKLITLLLVLVTTTIISSCGSDDAIDVSVGDNIDQTVSTVIDVDQDLFLGSTVTIVDCTLSNGTTTTCYQIVASTPTDHDMGPWCPDNISDDATAGGIWLENGEVYDVDGAFVANMATFYNDDTWLMYDENGDIYVTETENDCINAANPNVGEAYKNYCVECVPDYITDITNTWLIPTTPVKLTTTASFAGMGPPGQQTSGPSVRGIAFNGVEFSAAAPVDNILGAYTLAPFDDAGGHINVNQGYHYHAVTGVSTKVTQEDDHAAMIGYAADGHGIYEQKNEDDSEPSDLDGCRGHYDDTRGYHYHVDAAGSNNFINCLYGAYVN